MRIERYNLKLNLTGKENTFHGEETISLTGDSEHLVLDAVAMKFNKVQINGRDAEYSYEGGQLSINEEINGPADIFIDFDGEYSKSLNGMYLANAPEGKMITTQFESTGARYAFPCIDNPAYKAEFELSLIVDAKEEAISNMPPNGETFFNGTKIVEFEKTPRMSTYLLYIGVGKFEHIKMDYRGKDLFLTAPKGLLNTTSEPLEAASKIIGYYEKYFDIDFVLPKMHFISVPEFAAGAMENWGAITFREVALVLNKDTGTSTRAVILMVIGHEVAHQWFGNLVTMKWWDDLWLNESFANFMGYKSVHSLYDNLDMWAVFFNSEMAGGLRGDSLKNTHPIHATVDDPESIEQIFDEISYNKGGSILRMIESFMGEQNFRNGIREYLKNNSFSNATSEDLWNSLDRHSDYNVTEVMESWINMPGHPVIRVRKNGNTISLKQKTFKLLGSYDGDLWKIPVTVVTKSGTESMLLDQREGTVEAEGFIKLNKDTAGFYRVHYDDSLFDEIAKNLDSMSSYDLWGLVNDNYDFMLSNDITPDTYIHRLKPFMKSDDPLIVRTITGQFTTLFTILGANETVRKLAKDYLHEKLNMLGNHTEGEDPGKSMAREAVSNSLVFFDSEYAGKLSGNAKQLESVEPDLKQSVLFANALTENDPDFLTNLLKIAKGDEEKEKIIMSMGLMNSRETLEKAVEAIDKGLVKAQDMHIMYFLMSRHEAGREFLLEHFPRVLEDLRKVFAGTVLVSMFVENTVPNLSLRDRESAEKILDGIKTSDATSGVAKSREYIEIYNGLKERFH